LVHIAYDTAKTGSRLFTKGTLRRTSYDPSFDPPKNVPALSGLAITGLSLEI